MRQDLQIFDRLIMPQNGGLSAEHARYILSLDFSPDQRARYETLSAKVQDGGLSESEEHELDEFLAANAFLTVLQSKARLEIHCELTL